MEAPPRRGGWAARAVTAWCQRGTDRPFPEDAQLAKRLNVFLLCGFSAAAVQIVAMTMAGAWWSLSQLFAYVGLLICVRRLLLHGDHLRLAVHVGCGATFALLFGSTFLDGQALSPTLWFFGIVPLVATYLLGTRAGLLWTGVALASLVFVAVSANFLLVPQEVHQESLNLVVQQVSLLGILVGCAVGARALSDKQIQRLREQEQELRKVSQLKSEFLANMSHEIRTPMNGVLGLMELLESTELDPEQRELAATVSSSGRTLLRILDDVLDFSKIESGHLEIETVAFDLRRLVDEVAALFVDAAARKGLELVVEVDPTTPATVTGDPTRIRQVFVNLVGNAVKFTEAGMVAIAVGRAEGSLLELSVRDTGIGIPPEAHALLFEAFRQADGSTTRRYGGTGLGLTISNQLVQLMGGELTFTSAVGSGSVFTATLPLPSAAVAGVSHRHTGTHETGAAEAPEAEAAAEAEAEAAATAGPHAATPSLRALSVLVVEDNDVNQRITSAHLDSLGCDVMVATDGVEALRLAEAHRFDVVLMDCHMPRMDGFATTRELRGRPATTGTPIVAVTASVLAEDIERCRDAGMDDVLPKPFTRDQLGDVVWRWTREGARTQARGA